ncbi:glycosyltransferase family 4 protein [Winogradskyella litorisediminis]|uniref:Glycosyltransferase family 4 protein n=1 Tax=Winogradskyella litorisediminis TaxID=1156618 RepID=A0ABW3N938_9FLAO
MTNLLYIGNNINNAKSNLSSIQVLGKKLEAEGYHLRYASSYTNKLLRLFDMAWSCIKNAQWADAVLIDTYSTQNFYYALVCSQICRIFRVSYIPILHGGNLPERLKHNRKLSKLIFNHSHINVSPSKYLKFEFEQLGYSNIECIPNTIQIENYPVIMKNFDNIRLLWVRSFSEIYNPKMAIYVLKRLKENGCDAQLCMVGPDADGSLATAKQLAKKWQIDVTFTGKLDKKNWIRLSENYNLFINTTNFDNLPISVIEAMALGFPIVSTNVGGLPYLISDKIDGLLVDKNDIEAMTKAIISVVNSSKLAHQLSKHARETAEQYDWEQIKHKWFSVFATL